MKKMVLPFCLILASLVAAAFGIVHGARTISQDKATQIAFAKVRMDHNFSPDSSIDVNRAVLTNDVINSIAGTQQWILWTIGPKDLWSWIYIDAYSGKVTYADYGWKEWVVPTDTPPVERYTSWILVIPYMLMVIFSFFYAKRILRVLFWVSTASVIPTFFIYFLLTGLIALFG